MSKTRRADPDIAPEYNFSLGRRGVYLERAKRGIRAVIRTVGAEPDGPKTGAPPDADETPDAESTRRRPR